MKTFDEQAVELVDTMNGDPRVAGLPFIDDLVDQLLEKLVDGLAGAWCRRDPLDVLSRPNSREAKYAAGKVVLRANADGRFGLNRDQAKAVRDLLLEHAESTPRETLVAMRDEARAIHIPDYTLV